VRILFINQFYWPDVAATSQFLTDVTRALVAEGHEVDVLCGNKPYTRVDLDLGGHLKTGHTWPLQNRPTEPHQDKSIYNPPTAVSANIFRNPA
jgi:hypothetical protein